MGYMRHHAIVVTGISGVTAATKKVAPELLTIAEIQAKAKSICAKHSAEGLAGMIFCHVSEVTRKAINGYASFLVAPDGSKEGWSESEIGNRCRQEIVDLLLTAGASWVEVQFGDDNGETRVIRDSAHPEGWQWQSITSQAALEAVQRLRARQPTPTGTNYHLDLDLIEKSLKGDF